ncbi:uncharacterized protein AB675_3666 [Cyphellophora attinorum]|uniref:Uncharacterized protein n=1 Tax=Cyphellophora attinorum TaxID=1664694 RepID=A0A0N0NJW3_9EURO|nr:uncharacterized protein AB675_3666 [Phialophora attinorum]KPI37109.1 hypothetical protein AB675_3666 [Phialophora attinorum]
MAKATQEARAASQANAEQARQAKQEEKRIAAILQNPNKFGPYFGKLPPEIRKLIYSYHIEAYDHTFLEVKEEYYPYMPLPCHGYQITASTPFLDLLKVSKTIKSDIKELFANDQVVFFAKLDLKHEDSGKRFRRGDGVDFRMRASARRYGPLELHMSKLSWDGRRGIDWLEHWTVGCARDVNMHKVLLCCGGMNADELDMARRVGWYDWDEAEGEDAGADWNDDGGEAASMSESEMYSRAQQA